MIQKCAEMCKKYIRMLFVFIEFLTIHTQLMTIFIIKRENREFQNVRFTQRLCIGFGRIVVFIKLN